MATNNGFDISRREILAGLGTIGVASAGAGLGTTAYFSDTEEFEGNSLTAGELDLKVDWEEHYSDWQGEEEEIAEMADPSDADFVLEGFDMSDDYVSVEGPNEVKTESNPIALNFTGGTKDDFWDATSIEAYPDTGANGTANDGIQDDVPSGTTACEYLADVGGDVAGGLDPDGPRTDNEDTRLPDGSPAPLINLSDVKPGDFGEVTFSFHLCDNPGYVWLNGGLSGEGAEENGLTDPEADDPEEVEERVELLDRINTRFWYDLNCDNQVDRPAGGVGEGGQLDLMFAIDKSGSIQSDDQDNLEDGLNNVIDVLPDDGSVQVGTLAFGDDDVSILSGLTDLSEGEPDVMPSNFEGNTPLPAALDIANQYLDDNARSGATKRIVVFTDGGPNYRNQSYSAGGYTAPSSGFDPEVGDSGDDDYEAEDNVDGTVTVNEMTETEGVAEQIKAGDTEIATVYIGTSADNQEAMTSNAIGMYTNLPSYLTKLSSRSDLSFETTSADFGEISTGTEIGSGIQAVEEVFFQGSLRQALKALGRDPNGIPLDGDLSSTFDEINDPPSSDARDCFPARTDGGSTIKHCIGFQWWLPVDHANEIQTDSVEFDIGFYTEQCRHNPGGDTPGNGGGGGGVGDGGGLQGTKEISFVAFCAADDTADPNEINPEITAKRVNDAGEVNSIDWQTDVPVKKVVVFYAAKVTIFTYDMATDSGSAATGVPTNLSSDPQVVTRDAVLPGDARDPCGTHPGTKLENDDGSFSEKVLTNNDGGGN